MASSDKTRSGVDEESSGPIIILKVFQAAPLAYEDWTGRENPIPYVDFETECTILRKALEGTPVHPVFETATTNNLGLFLSQGSHPFLHFSCHGHPEYFLLENEYGGGHMLQMDEDLQTWFQAGGKNQLQFVFCSACHSRSAGETFVEAGVPHVVCCEQNEHLLSNMAAIVFARDFYQALAYGKTLQQAYDLAVQGVIQSPDLKPLGLNPKEEAKKFALLPEGVNHNVSLVSLASSSTMSSNSAVQSFDKTSNTPPSSMIPVPPQHFLGRELEMYRVLKALFVKKSRLVRITGPDGIGKVSLAMAVGHYMERRTMWGSIIWLPSSRTSSSAVSQKWSELYDLFENSHRLLPRLFRSDDTYKRVSGEILDQLYETKSVVILNAVKLSVSGIQKLCIFLDDLFEGTRHVKVLLVHRLGRVIQSQKNTATGFPCSETEISLGPLHFDCSVALFGRACPHAHDATTWHPERLLKKRTESTFKVLGEGVPAKTIIAAKNMTRDEYETLVEREDPIRESDFQLLRKIQDECCHLAVEEEEEDPLRLSLDASPDGATMMPNGASYRLGYFDEKQEQDQPPLRSQLQVQKRFVPLLKKQGKIYRKNVTSFSRRAVKGERIVTTIDGVQETEQTVKDDYTSWVVCGRAAGEHYVLTDQQFHESYDETTAKPIDPSASSSSPMTKRLHQQGFSEYQSIRQVWARKVDEHDMVFFRYGKQSPPAEEAYFMAPWGESTRVEQGDFLVTQYPGDGKGKDEVYRVEGSVFEYSYADPTTIKQQGKAWWRTKEYAITVASVVMVVAAVAARAGIRPRR
jgi:hypothetical protein